MNKEGKKKKMEINKGKRGITLIALIITIIVMLILVAVSVQIVINSGLFDSAKTAAKKTEEAYRAEGAEGGKVNIDGEIYNSIEEYMEKSCTHEWGEWQTLTPATCTLAGIKQKTCTTCKRIETETIAALGHCYTNYICTRCGVEDPNKPIEAGQYIKYDVAYTDVYMSSYNYTATNGWRLLHATLNGDGTYSDVELISTGIPAKFYYSSTSEGSWWISNSNKITTFKNLLGGSNYNFYNSGAGCEKLYAAAGFYYNFGILPFKGISSPSENYGGYTEIKNSNPKAGQTAGLGGALFLTNKASGVRLLTLKELNEARNLSNDPDNIGSITTSQDPIGLYNLSKLKSVPEIGTIKYSTSTAYWLASPYPDNDTRPIVLVNSLGVVEFYNNGAQGVRPVVKISRIQCQNDKVCRWHILYSFRNNLNNRLT